MQEAKTVPVHGFILHDEPEPTLLLWQVKVIGTGEACDDVDRIIIWSKENKGKQHFFKSVASSNIDSSLVIYLSLQITYTHTLAHHIECSVSYSNFIYLKYFKHVIIADAAYFLMHC